MLLGYEFVYPYAPLGDAFWVLLFFAPLLLFIGWYLGKIVAKDTGRPVQEEPVVPCVVLPAGPEMSWSPYTDRRSVIREISRAVIDMSNRPEIIDNPLTYEQIQSALHSPEAHDVARRVQLFYVYPQEAYERYLQSV